MKLILIIPGNPEDNGSWIELFGCPECPSKQKSLPVGWKQKPMN